jgi:hypothetical protein
LAACQTSPTIETAPEPEASSILETIAPPLPPAPLMESVEFFDRYGGLWLSPDNYRALERNVIALREYAKQLEIIIEFFTAEE